MNIPPKALSLAQRIATRRLGPNSAIAAQIATQVANPTRSIKDWAASISPAEAKTIRGEAQAKIESLRSKRQSLLTRFRPFSEDDNRHRFRSLLK